MNWTIWIIAIIVIALIVWTIVKRKKCGCDGVKTCETHTPPTTPGAPMTPPPSQPMQ